MVANGSSNDRRAEPLVEGRWATREADVVLRKGGECECWRAENGN